VRLIFIRDEGTDIGTGGNYDFSNQFFFFGARVSASTHPPPPSPPDATGPLDLDSSCLQESIRYGIYAILNH
jgi:hypothetical protein